MKQLRMLLHKEWRDQRLLALGALVVCVLFAVLGRLLGGTGFSAELRAEILPVLLALFAILLATESIARDVGSGVESTLARLPAARRVVWLSKAGFVTLMTAGGGLLLVALEWILRACEQRAAPTVSPLAPQYLVFIAAIAAACFASACMLRRALPAAFLGVLLVAIVPLVAWILPPFHLTEWIDVVLCAWTPTGLAAVGIAAFLLGSLFAFGTRHQDRFGLRRAARCALGGSLVLVPVFAGTARSAAWALDITPYSRTAKITFAFPSPDGRFIAIQAEQDWDPASHWLPRHETKPGFGTRWRREVWILDRSTGAFNQIDERYRFFRNNEPAWDEHGLLTTISTAGAFGGRDCAVESIEPRSGKVVSAREEDISEAVLPWWRKNNFGKDSVLRWPAKNFELRLPAGARLRPSAEPGIVFHEQDGFLVRHELDPESTSRLVALGVPPIEVPDPFHLVLPSPDGSLLYVQSAPDDRRLVDSCDGHIVRRFDMQSGWRGWSEIPGRLCIVWHLGDSFSALNEDGTETPLPGFESGDREVGRDHILRCEPQRIECMKLDGSEREVLYEARP